MLIYQHKCENKYIFINYSVVLETNKFLSISNFRFIVEIELTKINYDNNRLFISSISIMEIK
jgi:rRNA-processing protein FCF1